MITNNIQEVYKTNSNIYKYIASMKYVLNQDVYDIDSMNIKSIAIDNDYKNTNMPMLFVTVSISKKLIDKMVQNQDTGIVILEIQRNVANSDMPELFTKYINDKFIYFISEDINKTDSMDYKDSNKDRDDILKIVVLGLLSLDHVNKNKKSINGVVSGNLSSLMYYATNHLQIVIEPPKNNVKIQNKFLPPLNSTSKTLEYINNLYTFYPTSYRFFIDFDCAYLISSSGEAVRKKGEDITTVFLVLRNTFDAVSKLQGMITDTNQALYQIDCDGIFCELADNYVSDKSFSKLVATDTSGKKSVGSFSSYNENSAINSKSRSIRIMNDNTGLLDNMISDNDTSSIQLLIQKTDIDSSILTMNKEYIIKADEVYKTEKYNGRYILTRKRELYLREDDTFTMNTMLLFEKVPDKETKIPKVNKK